jgi:hypothetical protein
LLEPETVRRFEAERVPLQASYRGYFAVVSTVDELQDQEPGSELRKAILNANPDVGVGQVIAGPLGHRTTLAKMRVTVGAEHPEFRSMAAMQADLDQKVEDRIEGILTGLSLRVRRLQGAVGEHEQGGDRRQAPGSPK